MAESNEVFGAICEDADGEELAIFGYRTYEICEWVLNNDTTREDIEKDVDRNQIHAIVGRYEEFAKLLRKKIGN